MLCELDLESMNTLHLGMHTCKTKAVEGGHKDRDEDPGSML